MDEREEPVSTQNRCSKDGIGVMKGAVITDEPLVPLLSQEDLRVSLGTHWEEGCEPRREINNQRESGGEHCMWYFLIFKIWPLIAYSTLATLIT